MKKEGGYWRKRGSNSKGMMGLGSRIVGNREVKQNEQFMKKSLETYCPTAQLKTLLDGIAEHMFYERKWKNTWRLKT